MAKSEVIKAIYMWVLGMCYEYNQKMQIFSNFQTYYDYKEPGFANSCALWVQDCQNKVWHYVNGRQQVLDASCSDFQCTIAIKADQIFKNLLK